MTNFLLFLIVVALVAGASGVWVVLGVIGGVIFFCWVLCSWRGDGNRLHVSRRKLNVKSFLVLR
jgi:hypothetical protein